MDESTTSPAQPSSHLPRPPSPHDTLRSSLSTSSLTAADPTVAQHRPSYRSSVSASLTGWKESPLSGTRHLPPLRAFLTQTNIQPLTEDVLLASSTEALPLPSAPVMALSTSVSTTATTQLPQLTTPPILSPAQSAISINQLPALYAVSSHSVATSNAASGVEHSDTTGTHHSTTASDVGAESSDTAAEHEHSELSSRHALPHSGSKRTSDSDVQVEEEKQDASGKAGKRRWVRPAPIQALAVSSPPLPPSQLLPAAPITSSFRIHKPNQIVPFSPSSVSSASSHSMSSPPLPAHRASNLLSPSRIGVPSSSGLRPYPSVSSSRVLSPSGARSLITPPKALRSITVHAARTLSPSSAQHNNNLHSSSSSSSAASSLSSQLQLLRLSSIGQQHHLSPVFRADGEVEVRYLVETQRARRRYIARVLAIFVLAFVCVEALYVLMDGYDFWTVGWRALCVRGGYGVAVLTYCMLLRYWSRFMVSPTAMNRSLLLLMTAAVVTSLASTAFYIQNLSISASSIALAYQTLCVTLVLNAAFTTAILELPLTYSLTHSAIIIFFFNLALIHQLRPGLFDVDQHVYANLWLATVLCGLLLGRRQQETSRHIDFDKKRTQFLDRKKSVKLLQSMLPPQIIQNYLTGSVGQISAVATVGFCTIKLGPIRTRHDRTSSQFAATGLDGQPGTPSVLGGHSPAELMQRLHDTFKRIDGIVNLYAIRGVAKIETVSQQYLLCSGLLDTVDDHAAAMIEVCLEILHLTNRTDNKTNNSTGKSRAGGVPLSLQIGISTGSVVGGIIGTHRNFFKVFGDTVNVAARMCSKSEGGCILMSESTYCAMTDRQRNTFRISERRDIEVKGKGTMGTRQVSRKEEWVAKFGKAHRQTGGSASGDVRTAVLNQRIHYHKLVQSTSLHPLTLRYRWDTLSAAAVTVPLVERTEREELEHRFQCEWAPSKADLARRTTLLLAVYSTAAVIWGFCGAGTNWASQPSTPTAVKAMILVLWVVLIVSRVTLVCTQFFVRYLTPIIAFWTLYGVSVNVILFITSTYPAWFLPSLGMCLNIITPTILFQLHFGYALPLALLSLLAYVVVVVAASVEASVAAISILLVVLTMCLSFFILSSFERDLRFNFLLHFAMELEQRQMDKFLNNLLPKFVADLLSKRTVVNVNNERAEREGSRLSTAAGGTLHGRHSSMVDSPLPPHSPAAMVTSPLATGSNFGSSLSSGLLLPVVGSPGLSPLLSHVQSPSLLPNQTSSNANNNNNNNSIPQHIRSVSLSASAASNNHHPHNQHNNTTNSIPSYSSRFAMELRNATVFESDIVGYTAMASTWTASHTLHVLNTLFSKFDEAAAACGVEKIETIGDAFLVMAADGPPDPVLDFALRVLDELRDCNEKLSGGSSGNGSGGGVGTVVVQQLEVRVGVCSGVCFGGVIGDAVPRFHLFGDAHDAAVAIEQSGRAGEVLVSESTWSQSSSRYVYECMEGMVVAGVSGSVYALKGKANNNVIMHDADQRRNSTLH